MSLKKEKCGIIKLQKRRKTMGKKESLENNILGIPHVNEYRYLGIHFDARMYPAPHIDYLEKKLEKFIKMITIIRLQGHNNHITRYLF